jgi:hypothetical protein
LMRLSWFIASIATAAAALWGAQFALRAAPLAVAGDLPSPAALAAFDGDPAIMTPEDWLARRAPLLRAAFQRTVYGTPPDASVPHIVSRQLIDDAAFNELGRIEQLSLRFSGQHGEAAFSMLLITPRSARGPSPVVIVPNFCGNAAALAGKYRRVSAAAWRAPRCRTAAGLALTRTMHGANIIEPPFADLLRDGYAVATFSPAEIAPDDPILARAAIARLPDASADRLGAVGAWAWAISRVVDVLEAEPRVDHTRIAAFGHSRQGKAVLWAAASDPRIALVIANQSGRLGASPTRSRTGEQLPQLFQRYPHWFPASAGESAQIDIDQHLLLALIAPRPILLGAARLDRWSDPAGAFRSAEAATPVYRLFGGDGLDQPNMQSPNLHADIAVFLRPGGHGVRPRDWQVARAFLNAHFGAPGRADTAAR